METNYPRAEKTEATTRRRPAGATSTGDGEPLPGAEKTEATTRQRPAGATSNEAASNLDLPIYPDLKSLSVARPPIDRVSRVFSPITKSSIWIFVKISTYAMFSLNIAILDDTLDTNVEFVGFATISLCSGCGNNAYKLPKQVDNRLRDSCNLDSNHRRQPYKFHKYHRWRSISKKQRRSSF